MAVGGPLPCALAAASPNMENIGKMGALFA